MKTRIVVLATSLLFTACAATPQATQPLRPRALATVPEITVTDLTTRLYLFAHDSMQGCRTGVAGNLKAAAYIEHEVRRLGLTPAGDSGGYFQMLPLVRHAVSDRSFLTVDGPPPQLGAYYRSIAAWPHDSVSGLLALETHRS